MEIWDVWSLEVKRIGLNVLFEIRFSASAGFITDAEAGELIISSDLQNVMDYFCSLDWTAWLMLTKQQPPPMLYNRDVWT